MSFRQQMPTAYDLKRGKNYSLKFFCEFQSNYKTVTEMSSPFKWVSRIPLFPPVIAISLPSDLVSFTLFLVLMKEKGYLIYVGH